MNITETARLNLRHIELDDAPFLLELLNDPAFIKNIGDRGVRSLEDARLYALNGPLASYEKHGFGLFLVELKASGEPIGICGLLKRDTLEDVDIGFAFLPSFRSQGYALEAASATKSYALNVLGLKRIVAVVVPENTGSIKLLERLGLKYERRVQLTESEPEIMLYALDA